MAFTPADKKMLEGYVAAARPFADMFSVKGKTALVTGGTSPQLSEDAAQSVVCHIQPRRPVL